jgi:hypothetical protein
MNKATKNLRHTGNWFPSLWESQTLFTVYGISVPRNKEDLRINKQYARGQSCKERVVLVVVVQHT